MPTERVQIIITEKGGVATVKTVRTIGQESTKTASALDGMKSAMLGLGAAAAAGLLISFSDAATRVTNTLKQAGLAGDALTQSQDRLYAAAIQNGQETESLASVYLKLSAASKELGITNDQAISSVEGIAAAMRLSTAGTGAQAGALQQLSQLLGGTMVQAQEYNSLIDGAYPLLQAVAQGSDKYAGSVAALTRDVKAGNVSVKEFYDAMEQGLPSIIALSQSIPLTIGQSFVSLRQAFQQWVGESPQANVAINAISQSVAFLARNINVIAPILASVGAALAAAFIGGQIVSATTNIIAITSALLRMGTTLVVSVIPAVIGFSVALLANPITIVTLSLIALSLVLLNITDYFMRGNAGWESWRASAVTAIDGVKAQFGSILTFMGNASNIMINGTDAANALTTSGKTTATTIKSYMDASGKTISVSIPQGANQAKPIITQAVKDGGDIAAKAIADSIEQISKTLTDAVNTSFDPSIDKLTASFDAFNSANTTFTAALTTWGTTFTATLTTTFSTFGTAINQSLNNTFTKFITNATQWGNAFVQSFDQAAQAAANAIRSAAASAAAASAPGVGAPAFATGGQFRVGGSGGTDTQKVAFMATPGERVTVETPTQQRQNDAAHNGAGQAGNTASNGGGTDVIAVFDLQSAVSAMGTRQGRSQFLKNVQADRDQIVRALGL